MKRLIILASVICLCGGFLACNSSPSNISSNNTASTASVDPPIKYEVLRQWIPGGSGTGMDVLVSPNATKAEVLALAEYFVAKYRSMGQMIIFIFDLKEVWANRDNDNYPQKKYFQHYLVTIMVPQRGSGNEITWSAEGRIEPTR